MPVLGEDGKPVLDDNGKPKMQAKYSWHAFRHFAISAWMKAGLDPKHVQTLAGLSNLSQTMDRYSHFMPRADDHQRVVAVEASLLG